MKLRDDTVERTDNALQCAAHSLSVAVGLVRRVIQEYRELRPALRQKALLAMRQGAMLAFLTCAVAKGYLRADEILEDLTEERKPEKELRNMEMRDRRLTVVINKDMVFPGQDIHSMTKAEQDKLLKLMGQDAQLVVPHNKDFGSAVTVNGWNALLGAERSATMKPVGQDAQLVAAHNKGFVRAASVNARNALRLGGRLRCSNECCWTRQSFDP